MHYVCVTSMSKCCPNQIKSVHYQSVHSGIKWILYFTRLINPVVYKTTMKVVLSGVPVHWSITNILEKSGMHGVEWWWTLIIIMPITIWCWLKQLHWHDSTSIIDHLTVVFFKQAPPDEFHNDIAFCSKLLKDFFDKWVSFAAYVPLGNRIVDRCHWSIKLIAARKQFQ